jgi:Heat induced stress protein YflT domain
MQTTDTIVAVFADHNAAETAIKKLTASGFEMKNLSVVGKGYHTDEKVVGFYNLGDRVKFWGCAVRSGEASGVGSSAECS